MSNKFYNKIIITINLKESVNKFPIPLDFKLKTTNMVNNLFPNWKTIEYDFQNKNNDNNTLITKN